MWFNGYVFSKHFVILNMKLPFKKTLMWITSSFMSENAGVLEGQKGCWLLFECPGTDADMQVSSQLINTIHNTQELCFNNESMISSASWISMPLRGRTRPRAWAWSQRRAAVSPHVHHFSSLIVPKMQRTRRRLTAV